MWFWVPATMIFLAIIGWAVLSGFPLRERKERKVTARTLPVVQERPATQPPADLTVDVRETRSRVPEGVPGNTVKPVPERVARNTVKPVPEGVARNTVKPVPEGVARNTVKPVPERRAETTRQEVSRRGELSESEAVSVLLREVARLDYYDIPRECLSAKSNGYSNRGYAIEVRARDCGDRASGLLGRWRVDTVTRQVFVQKANGKFLRP